MKAEEFDKIFDDGKTDVVELFDLSSASRPGLELKRVNVDFPTWVVESLDREANRLGVPRQSLIKMWIADRLKEEKVV